MGSISYWSRYKPDPTAQVVTAPETAVPNGQVHHLKPAPVRCLKINTGASPGVFIASVFGGDPGKDTAMLVAWLSDSENGPPIPGPRGYNQSSGVTIGGGVNVPVDVGDSVMNSGGMFFEFPPDTDVILNVATDWPRDVAVILRPMSKAA